jgi:hypothetical protein
MLLPIWCEYDRRMIRLVWEVAGLKLIGWIDGVVLVLRWPADCCADDVFGGLDYKADLAVFAEGFRETADAILDITW